MTASKRAFAFTAALLLAGCGTLPPPAAEAPAAPQPPAPQAPAPAPTTALQLADDSHAQDAVIYALGLIGNQYRFGGRNPDSGLDCSGMVSWIFEQVAGIRLPHNAAQIARLARPVDRASLQPGDLVFFNTSGKPHSHMGIYAGEGRFIHAPSTRGKYVRTDALDSGWFAARISGLRTLRRDV
ncbi:C40 family peptidase [Methyloversatilis discipulorum]|uniref:C40 family peptidase n=1 Tax=Methyloversatilis discipulorum TaxID=1119528 RepID=UPI000363B486|nr:C40 family peptidase [Methyloversatilis discipulorum]